jgi:Family of unknown function (DUF6252)
MSRVRTLPALLLIVTATALTSAAPPHKGAEPHKGTMSATVDGAPWTAEVISAAAIQGGVLRIGGQSHTKAPFVALGIAAPPKVGTYSVGPATGASVAGSLVDVGNGAARQWNADGGAGSGTVTLTELTPARASGTFSFTLVHMVTSSTGTKIITNGKFDVTF